MNYCMLIEALNMLMKILIKISCLSMSDYTIFRNGGIIIFFFFHFYLRKKKNIIIIIWIIKDEYQ